ncbi:MAG: ABC transporter ATP-binding protein [Pseudobdellovibrio sp.]|nr:ABC transporter ATP-binding protein [Pseudobdellovibrio sp.]
MSLALNAINLKKTYDGIPVVNGISFEIKPGECVGILGPNGAGKTTTIKMIYGQVVPSAGELLVLGLNTKNDIAQIRSRIGVVPQEDCLDTDFSALENLLLFGRYHNMDRDLAEAQAEHLLAEMKLSDFKHKRVEALSGGMKRRLAIARALIHKPQFILMDEPTTGLDPQARLWIWNYFERLKSNNTTLVLTTHYMEEAERLCDRIIMIDHGVILDHGTAKELIERHVGLEVIELEVGKEKGYWINKVEQAGLRYQEYEENLFIFFKTAESKQGFISHIQNTHYYVRAANLNDVFLKLAGYQIREKS